MENDLISREVAIDAVKRLSLGETDATRLAMRIGDYLKRVPPAQPLTEEDYIELHDRFGTYVEEVARDMISGEGKRWKEKI